ncbi:Formate-dependent nitrite reductase membrane component [Rubrobacter radiotolerans]|uniref:Formate-dependent nitrite reductase membrane component n=1 Tax=Rubrobacter radiotolerans TaxID=42256 RepID=A0A023X6J7_RUBRA|nr:NrfD/PsrC family molybdoenzyme membrane anchor subunit [Rubrobacter radiotolerans]AHY47851.1 Formate-dependent nitrite reductase membrane component [Rubrobacter radiotolerans]MDX5892490.1 NrfD/PsrC family molybdoenzyme membrane anchor subunit [Rubrobacter radiotolerans]SMC07781.1 Formate-dependent nitrite reductase, membrane component NrfD [Rubrobacter radiotolerans DSM 5868]
MPEPKTSAKAASGESPNGARPETSHHPKTDKKREDEGYYGIPPLKASHWAWQIYVYFFVGGIGAGAHLASVMGQLFGWRDAAFFRVCRYTTLVAMIVSPVMLIWDLGRPERFLNMLRILKLRSPMSTGSWALSVFGSLSGAIATRQAAEDGLLGRDTVPARLAGMIPAKLISVASLPVALYVGAYTGLLLVATSIPLWARNWIFMGPLFLSSAVSTGLSWISFVLHLGRWGEVRTLHALRRAERVVLVAEAALLAASLLKTGRWSKPLFSKRLGPLFVGGTIFGGIVAPFLLLLGKESRGKSLLSGGLVLLGGYILRYVMVRGGHDSANDPEQYFSFARKGRREVREGESTEEEAK